MDTGTLSKKAQAHKRAAKAWDKAYKAHREAMQAVFLAESIEREIGFLEVDTLKPVHLRRQG